MIPILSAEKITKDYGKEKVIKGTHFLFCDEATGALDEENSKKVVGLLHSLKNTFGVTILFTTHNEQIAHTAIVS